MIPVHKCAIIVEGWLVLPRLQTQCPVCGDPLDTNAVERQRIDCRKRLLQALKVLSDKDDVPVVIEDSPKRFL
jgi:hypothetical protein